MGDGGGPSPASQLVQPGVWNLWAGCNDLFVIIVVVSGGSIVEANARKTMRAVGKTRPSDGKEDSKYLVRLLLTDFKTVLQSKSSMSSSSMSSSSMTVRLISLVGCNPG